MAPPQALLDCSESYGRASWTDRVGFAESRIRGEVGQIVRALHPFRKVRAPRARARPGPRPVPDPGCCVRYPIQVGVGKVRSPGGASWPGRLRE